MACENNYIIQLLYAVGNERAYQSTVTWPGVHVLNTKENSELSLHLSSAEPICAHLQ